MAASSQLSKVSGNLLNLYDDELSGFQRCKAHLDVDYPEIAIILSGSFSVTLYEEGLVRRGSLEGTLTEEAHHESIEIEPDFGPEWFVVRFKHHPLRASVE